MKVVGGLIIVLYAIGIIAAILIILYLIVKRVEEKDNETFEKRKN